MKILLAVMMTAMVAIAGFRAPVRAQLSAESTNSAQPAQSVWDGIYTAEQAERGDSLYAKGCAECHGPDLAGDDMAPPLVGDDFLWDWNGLSVGDLFERLRVSMPDGDARSMTNQEKADVLAFVLLKNDFPVGETELANRTQALKPIAFEAAKH